MLFRIMTSGENTLFPAAVATIFDSWTVLQLAVNQGFGGAESREKAEWMITAVDQWFRENKDIEVYELDDFLADVMNTEFDTIVEDGSLSQISTLICRVYKLCCEGKEDEVREQVQCLPKAAVQNCSRVAGNDEEEDDNEEDSSDRQGGSNLSQASCNGGLSNGTDNTSTQGGKEESKEEKMETEEEEGWTTVHRGKRR
ncbi:pre-rRNA-processing protein TSR2 homolog [Saccostrea echinata]|uniref:pre-rRNA-processing protein TSR2 homolog n=1 Tax=Saccostrea echinata TaxID=191078 RepID=UPI002A80F3DF|nr:pre-rRNA-processing protein TSR2 homolog [Saccostrea echinata]